MGADVSALLEAAVSQASEPVQPGGQPGPGGGPATQVPSLSYHSIICRFCHVRVVVSDRMSHAAR